MRIFLDLDNFVFDEKKLDVVYFLKIVLDTMFKILVLEILEVKRMEDFGDNGFWF